MLLLRLKAAWMDLMPVHTAQSPEFIASVQEANARRIAAHQQAAGTRALPPDLLQTDNPEVLRQRLTGMQTRRRDAFPLNNNLVAQFLLNDTRNMSLEKNTYEMMKTQCHDLFITTRTSIQDPSIRPSGRNRSNTFSSKENTKEKKAFGRKTKKDKKVLCPPMMRRHFGYWRRMTRLLRERCLGGIADSRREKEKENRQAKRVTNKVASNPFEKVALAGRPIWPAKIRIPTTRHIGEKAKGKKGKKGKPNSISMMETKAIHL